MERFSATRPDEPLEAVVFDIGNVLVDWNPRYIYRDFFDGDEAAMEHFLAHVCAPEWNREIDAGKPFDEAVSERQKLYPEYADLIAAWRDLWPKSLGGAIEGTVDILAAVKGRGYPLYAITNWSAETFPVARERFPFLAWFRDIVVSGEVGIAKPDRGIFEIFLGRHPIDPRKAVFIDDSPPNLVTAASVGLAGIRFVDPETLRRDLQDVGVL